MPLEAMLAEVNENRYVPVLSCEQQEQFLFLDDEECEDEADET